MLATEKERPEQGFSLVEILIAIVILALVALGIMALLPGGYKQITNSGRTATLNHLGQMQLDYLRTLPITHNDLVAATHPTSGIPLWPLGSDQKYSVKWTVDVYTPLTNTRSVLVEVGYDIYNTDGSSKNSSETLEQKRIVFPTMISQ
jgi:prepilin-type N-terminal cleavage/methylation domain-containing protein